MVALLRGCLSASRNLGRSFKAKPGGDLGQPPVFRDYDHNPQRAKYIIFEFKLHFVSPCPKWPFYGSGLGLYFGQLRLTTNSSMATRH